jgi:hypothetical protein
VHVGREAQNWGMKEIPHKRAFSPEEMFAFACTGREALTTITLRNFGL